MNKLIKQLEDLSEDAYREGCNYSDISREMAEYQFGFAEGINKAIELLRLCVDTRITENLKEENE